MRKRLRRLHKTYRAQSKKQARRFRRLSRHPVAIPAVIFVSLCIVSLAGLLFIKSRTPSFRPISSYIVLISHDHVQQTVPTREPTVEALLKKVGIGLNQGDVVEPSADTPITQDNFRVNVYRAVPVEIIDGAQQTFSFSAAATPRSIAQQAGTTIYPEDGVQVKPVSNFLTEHTIGEQIIIQRATPVNFNLYGTQTVIRTHAETVGALLAAQHVKLAKGDTLQPAATTPITAGVQVFVTREGTQLTTVEQNIPTPIQYIEDGSLTFGTSAVRQQGSPGKELVTYQINLRNGVEVGRTAIQTVITVQPVTQIVARGKAVQIPGDKQAVMAAAGISSSDYAYVNYIMSNESGWCPTKLQGQYGSCPGYAPSYIPPNLGYGLGQATPGDKMAPFGADWRTNPVTQLRWASSYAAKYGGWGGSYNFWQAHHYW